MGKIYAAKTNHITNPLGFYMEQIVFSWILLKQCTILWGDGYSCHAPKLTEFT